MSPNLRSNLAGPVVVARLGTQQDHGEPVALGEHLLL